ncbi:hypothetical protein D9M71_770630 [compost metagenome]
MGAVGQFAATLDLLTGALQLGGIAIEQAVELAFEGDPGVFYSLAGLGLEAHEGGKVVGIGFAGSRYAEQGQAIEYLGLVDDQLQFALHLIGQRAASAADQFVAGQGKP